MTNETERHAQGQFKIAKPKKENKFGYQGNVVSSRLHLKEMMQFFQPMLAKCSELMTELVEDEDPYPMWNKIFSFEFFYNELRPPPFLNVTVRFCSSQFLTINSPIFLGILSYFPLCCYLITINPSVSTLRRISRPHLKTIASQIRQK